MAAMLSYTLSRLLPFPAMRPPHTLSIASLQSGKGASESLIRPDPGTFANFQRCNSR